MSMSHIAGSFYTNSENAGSLEEEWTLRLFSFSLSLFSLSNSAQSKER